ncbi:unnamed protein product [Protopolystoma xenopodis]|uniref:Uncharacterized protein n=1 Tax=Protopolystoma xenopodis TaxID=117903 RepID=A0A3S5FD84_9PLAT|nr:unnamed protein product [Protopolystoma xenopodis]
MHTDNRKVYGCVVSRQDHYQRREDGLFDADEFDSHPERYISTFSTKASPYQCLKEGVTGNARFCSTTPSERKSLFPIQPCFYKIVDFFHCCSLFPSPERPHFTYRTLRLCRHQWHLLGAKLASPLDDSRRQASPEGHSAATMGQKQSRWFFVALEIVTGMRKVQANPRWCAMCKAKLK